MNIKGSRKQPGNGKTGVLVTIQLPVIPEDTEQYGSEEGSFDLAVICEVVIRWHTEIRQQNNIPKRNKNET
jgi:hypothetical protein